MLYFSVFAKARRGSVRCESRSWNVAAVDTLYGRKRDARSCGGCSADALIYATFLREGRGPVAAWATANVFVWRCAGSRRARHALRRRAWVRGWRKRGGAGTFTGRGLTGLWGLICG